VCSSDLLNLSIPKGAVGATPNFTVGTVTTGEPGSSVIVTITGTPEAPVLNVTIPQGMQGNTGSSVEYPYELVNNLTTDDATKGLSAAQGKVLDGKVSQLEAKVDGEVREVIVTKVDTYQDVYINNSGAFQASSSGMYIDAFKVNPGQEYKILLPRTPNGFKIYGWNETCPKTGNLDVTDCPTGAYQSNYEATVTAVKKYLYISYYNAQGAPTLKTTESSGGLINDVAGLKNDVLDLQGDIERIDGDIDGLQDDIDAIVDGEVITESVLNVFVSADHYMSVQYDGAIVTSYSGASVAFFPIVKGGKYIINVPKACNNAGYVLGYTEKYTGDFADADVYELSDTVGTFDTFSYTIESAPDHKYLAVCYTAASGLPTVTYEYTEKMFVSHEEYDAKIAEIEEKIDGVVQAPLLHDKRIFLFGASAASNSTPGVTGFGKLIANAAGIPYRGFVYDSADGNTQDVVMADPNFTNYAKDGTCLRVISGRNDGIVARIKRHIDEDAEVDYVVLMFPANDAASQYTNMGQMEQSYTADFDTDTQLGALEEVCKYVTEIGRPFKFGCIFCWDITWVAADFYDPYIPVLQKWGIPYLDLRKTSGFDIKRCAAHRRLYSLTGDNYESWNENTVYELDSKVKYGGVLYKSTQDNNVGHIPTDTDYWMEVSSDSGDGTHLNSTGNVIVAGKILSFIESL